MRLLVSLGAAIMVALALFGLMVLLVMPPQEEPLPEEEIARVGFVRSVSDTSSEERQQRRQLPERPEPPDTPEPPAEVTPQPAVQTEASLDLAIPDVPTQISLSMAPSLDTLSPAPSEPQPAVEPVSANTEPAQAQALVPAETGDPGIEEDVTPLVDIPPNYPQRASAAGIEGKVVLRFIITAEGRVDNLRVTEAEPPGVFDREARRAASRWRFSPRRENGQPVPREATKTLYFRLQGRGR